MIDRSALTKRRGLEMLHNIRSTDRASGRRREFQLPNDGLTTLIEEGSNMAIDVTIMPPSPAESPRATSERAPSPSPFQARKLRAG
ncbi:hypothetical protein A1351_19575 [Methylosinus sp. R-45379]|nr:hypothetical protein A1351_19575 [Methylosinus sp. R-45379]